MNVYAYIFHPVWTLPFLVDKPSPRYIYDFFQSFKRVEFEWKWPIYFCSTSSPFPGYSVSFWFTFSQDKKKKDDHGKETDSFNSPERFQLKFNHDPRVIFVFSNAERLHFRKQGNVIKLLFSFFNVILYYSTQKLRIKLKQWLMAKTNDWNN